MAQQVPAVERALDILELFGEGPDDALGLSEVARALSMNKASCYATLTLLAERGYLIRHRDKTYSLGPATLALANLFLRDQDALAHARAEMAALSRDLNLDCIASTVIDDDMVILAKTASQTSFGVSVRVGSRVPLVPPLGTVFLAWAPSERVQQWLDSLPPATTTARERYLEALAVVRDRGYSLAIGRRPAGAPPPDVDDYLLLEVGSDEWLPIAHIAAPVFDPEGTVRLALTVIGFQGQLAAHDVPAIGERLVAATTTVARATWGSSRHDSVASTRSGSLRSNPEHRPTRRRIATALPD